MSIGIDVCRGNERARRRARVKHRMLDAVQATSAIWTPMDLTRAWTRVHRKAVGNACGLAACGRGSVIAVPRPHAGDLDR